MSHDESGIKIVPIMGIVIASVLVLAVCVAALRTGFIVYSNHLVYKQVLSVPGTDIADRKAAQDSLLNSYGWADTTRTAVRIPIERAMELVISETKGRPGGSGD